MVKTTAPESKATETLPLLMTRLRRSGPFWLLIAFSLVYVARDPAPQLTLIDLAPPGADWVSLHADVADRVEAFLQTDGAAPLGLQDEDRLLFSMDWVQKLIPGDLLVSRLPGFYADSSGWLFLSRVGPGHARLRLLATFFGVEGFERIEKHHGRVIYYRESRGEGDPPVWAALGKGVLVVGVHTGPAVVRQTLDRVDGLRPGFGQVFPMEARQVLAGEGITDRGIWRAMWMQETQIFWQREPSEDHAVSIRVSGLEFPSEVSDASREVAARLAGGTAFFNVPLPPFSFGGLSMDVPTRVLILGPPYTGGYPRAGWPGLIWMVPESAAESPLSWGRVWADLFTKHTGIPHEMTFADGEIQIHTPPDLSRSEGRTGHPGARAHAGWYLFTNNLDLLGRLQERWERPEAEFEQRNVPYHDANLLGYASGTRFQALYGGRDPQWLAAMASGASEHFRKAWFQWLVTSDIQMRPSETPGDILLRIEAVR